MFVSCGVWGAVAPILPPKVAVGGALTTGALLFAAIVARRWTMRAIEAGLSIGRLPEGV
jgi:hypothetical protein